MKSLIKKIQKNLTPDLLSKKYKNQTHSLSGHCYVATESLYHLLPNKNEYKPVVASINNITHWWLQHRKTGKIIDITAKQFNFKFPYHLGKGTGFLTKTPSKRSIILMSKVNI